MDITHPLASLFSSVEGAALAVVSSVDGALSGRRVHVLATTGSVGGIHRALGRLVDVGIVSAESTSHATLYRANRQHLLWPAIEAALSARLRFEQRIVETTESLGTDGFSVALFGSVARGDSNASSDIDVLVVHPDDAPAEQINALVDSLLDQIPAWTGNRAQVLPLSRTHLAQLARSGDPIGDTLRAHHRLLIGPPLKPLLEKTTVGAP